MPSAKATASNTSPWFSRETSTLRRTGKAAFLLLVSAYFAFCYASNHSYLDLPLYVQGGERLPYQFRILPAFVFRLMLRSHFVLRAAAHVRPLHGDPYRFILLGIAFASVLGATLAARWTISRLTGDAVFAFWTAFLTPLMALLLDASCWGPSPALPYDIPALFFFGLSVALIVNRKLWLYLLLFPLAVLNRETSCFIALFFAIWEWVRLKQLGMDLRARLLRILPVVAVQAAIWLAIKLWLSHRFGHNPTEVAAVGGLFVSKLGYNLHEVAKPEQWPLLLSLCGFSLPFLYLQRRWMRNDSLFWCCAVILPLYFAAMMLVGVIVEVRIFTEWIALVVPAVALIVHNRFRPVS